MTGSRNVWASGLILSSVLSGCRGGAVVGPSVGPPPSPTPSVTIVTVPVNPRPSPGTPGPSPSSTVLQTPLPSAPPTVTPTLAPGQTPSPTPVPTSPGPKIYVVNHSTFGAGNAGAPSVTVYPANANGDATPIATLAGSATMEDQIFFTAVDSNSTLYLGNQNGATNSGTVTAFTGPLGNVAPAKTLTGLAQPVGIAVDATNALYVGELGALEVYSPGATAGAPPLHRIAGSNTSLSGQSAYEVFVERTGKQDVALQNAVVTFPYGADGNVAPLQNIYGEATGIVYALGVAADSSGNLFVTNFNLNDVLEFGPSATGDSAPAATIASTSFDEPWGIYIDASDNVYVANRGNDSILVFAAGTFAAGIPTATISGAHTGLDNPTGVFVR